MLRFAFQKWARTPNELGLVGFSEGEMGDLGGYECFGWPHCGLWATSFLQLGWRIIGGPGKQSQVLVNFIFLGGGRL